MRNYVGIVGSAVVLLLVLLDVRPASSNSGIQQTTTESHDRPPLLSQNSNSSYVQKVNNSQDHNNHSQTTNTPVAANNHSLSGPDALAVNVNINEQKINSTDRDNRTDATLETPEDQNVTSEIIDEILHKIESLGENNINETGDPSEVWPTTDYSINIEDEESLDTDAQVDADTTENSITDISEAILIETVIVKDIQINNINGSKETNIPVTVVMGSIDEVDSDDSTTIIDEEFVDVDNMYNDAVTIASTGISIEDDTISLAKSNSSGGNYSDKYEYFVYDNSTVPCILAAMSITLEVNYYTIDFEKTTKTIRVPRHVMVSGQCRKNESRMILSWPTKAGNWNNITFGIENDGENFYVDHVRISMLLDNSIFPNALDTTLAENSVADLGMFSAPLQNGAYFCKAQTKFSCGEIDVELENVSLIAFNDMQSDFFRKEIDCDVIRFDRAMTLIFSAFIIIILVSVVASLWYKRRTGVYRSELP